VWEKVGGRLQVFATHPELRTDVLASACLIDATSPLAHLGVIANVAAATGRPLSEVGVRYLQFAGEAHLLKRERRLQRGTPAGWAVSALRRSYGVAA
jgi:hypothetical protein